MQEAHSSAFPSVVRWRRFAYIGTHNVIRHKFVEVVKINEKKVVRSAEIIKNLKFRYPVLGATSKQVLVTQNSMWSALRDLQNCLGNL